MSKKDIAEKLGRFGYVGKGIVYFIVGALSATYAFGSGGAKEGKRGMLKFIDDLPLGNVLLWVIAVLLLGYVAYKLYKAIANPSGKTDKKHKAKRLAYVGAAIFYGFIIYTSVSLALTSGNSSGGDSETRKTIIQNLLEMPAGQILVAIVALFFFAKGFDQFYRAIKGTFLKKVKKSDEAVSQKEYTSIKWIGITGLVARGIVLLIIGYFFMRASLESDASHAEGTAAAFSFIQQKGGIILLGIIALGMAAYGVFMFLKAKYAEIME